MDTPAAVATTAQAAQQALAAPAAQTLIPTTPADDPFISFLKWVSVIALVLLVGAKPVMAYVRQQNDVSNQNKKDDAEGALYTHLAEQVREYRKLADTAFNERNNLLVRVTELEMRVSQFAEAKEQISLMQERLSMKDEIIANMVQQGAEERTRFLQILEAKDVQYATLEKSHRELEARVTRDEVSLGVAAVCPIAVEAAKTAMPDVSGTA